MKLHMQIKKRMSAVLIFGMLLSSTAALKGNHEQAVQPVVDTPRLPLAGFAVALGPEHLAALDGTAGVSDVLMDASVVNVMDTGLYMVGQGIETMSLEADEPAMETEANEPETEEIFGYHNLGIACVEGNLNVRKSPSTDSSVVGKMTNHAACEILAEEDGWYQIVSGKVEGYVKSEYLITGDEACAIAMEEITLVATVNTSSLRVRETPSTDAAILTKVNEGEILIVKNELDGWYEVEVDNLSGFVAGEYVEVSLQLPTAQTITELRYGKGVSDVRVELVQFALQYVGNRYVWGGTSLTKGVDCSGFTMQVYAHFGVKLPHYSGSQPAYGTKVKASEARPGDLFFYGSNGKIGHVGIYIGNGQIVHASSARTGIKVSNAFYRTPICVVSYLP